MTIESWQQAAWKSLRDRLVDDRLPHAILIQGPEGVGKRSLVDHFLRAVLCESDRQSGEPCGECRGCRLAAAGTHPDLHRISLEENSQQLKIDQIRELSRRVGLTSSRGPNQVFVVDPADRMNAAAANAFLKTLEEPSAGSVIILVAEASHRLPPTILSRCQRIMIGLPPSDQALEFLERSCDRPRGELAAALKAAGGSPGRALAFVQENRAATYDETVADLEALASGRGDPVDVADRWVADDPELRLQWMASALKEAAWAEVRSADGLPTLTAQRDLASLTRIVEETYRTSQLLDSTLRPELLVESLLVAWKQGRIKDNGGAAW